MTPTRTVVVALVVAAALALTGCGAKDESGTSKGGAGTKVVEVPADAETQPMQHSGDSADDPAIWVNHDDPAKSLVIGNDKQGALETYNLDGTLVQRISRDSKFWGNVDVRQDVQLADGADRRGRGGQRRACGCTPSTRPPASSRRSRPAALRSTPAEGRASASTTARTVDCRSSWSNISGNIRQYALEDDGAGSPQREAGPRLQGRFRGRGLRGRRREQGALHRRGERRHLEVRRRPRRRREADDDGRLEPKGHQIPDIEGITLVDDGAARDC